MTITIENTTTRRTGTRSETNRVRYTVSHRDDCRDGVDRNVYDLVVLALDNDTDRETVVDAIGELLCEERQPETDAEHEEILRHAEELAVGVIKTRRLRDRIERTTRRLEKANRHIQADHGVYIYEPIKELCEIDLEDAQKQLRALS